MRPAGFFSNSTVAEAEQVGAGVAKQNTLMLRHNYDSKSTSTFASSNDLAVSFVVSYEAHYLSRRSAE